MVSPLALGARECQFESGHLDLELLFFLIYKSILCQETKEISLHL